MLNKLQNRQRGFTLVEIMIVLAIIGLIVSIAVPAFLKNRRDAQGSACNGQLDAIFSAKEQIAFKMNVRPGGPQIAVDTAQINSYLRGTDVTALCPGGGAYNVGATINDANGLVIVPTCSMSSQDSGGGVTFEADGLHIHRRSYTQDANGAYVRLGGITFAS